jgi:hypothetical protein
VLVLGTFALSFSLAGCSGGSDGSSGVAGQDCTSLTDTVDEARANVQLSTELSTHEDSDGGATVTDSESQEIEGYQTQLETAQSAAEAAGCS